MDRRGAHVSPPSVVHTAEECSVTKIVSGWLGSGTMEVSPASSLALAKLHVSPPSYERKRPPSVAARRLGGSPRSNASACTTPPYGPTSSHSADRADCAVKRKIVRLKRAVRDII